VVPVIDWWEAERIARRRLLGRRRSQTYRLRRAAQREASAADNGLSADLVEGSRQEGGWQGEWPDEETTPETAEELAGGADDAWGPAPEECSMDEGNQGGWRDGGEVAGAALTELAGDAGGAALTELADEPLHLMELPEDLRCLVPPYLGHMSLGALGLTCWFWRALPARVEALRLARVAWQASLQAAAIARAGRQAVASERRRVQAEVRRAYPLGAIVFGAPLARGSAVESDYDLRIIVSAPANDRDDYLLGHMTVGGTFGVASVGQRGLPTTFTVVLEATEACLPHPPLLLDALECCASPGEWQASVGELRASLGRYLLPRASPLRGP